MEGRESQCQPMKIGASRKDKIELVLKQAQKLSGCEAAIAWQRLRRELEFMSEPEARPPRFARLLRAIWVAATNEQS